MADKKPSYPPPYPEGTETEAEPVEYPKHVTNADGDTVTVNSKEEEAKVKGQAKKAEKDDDPEVLENAPHLNVGARKK